MYRALPLICAGILGLIAPARAADKAVAAFTKGTPVVVVGQVSSPPKGAIEEKKMQVAVGPEKTDYTLHFRKAQLFGFNGQKIDEDGLDDGMWVRAEGKVMDDPRRIEVSRVQVIGKDTPAAKRSAFFRPGLDFGYVTAVAGARQTFPAVTTVSPSGAFVLVGKVHDDTGAFERTRKLQVQSAGNIWTIHVPKEAPVIDAKGEKISVHEVKQGQWVRAHGWRTDDLRMRVERLENVGKDEAFRGTTFFRTDYPLGYVDVIEGTDVFVPVTFSGSVLELIPDYGAVRIRDAQGKESIIYTDTGTIKRGDRPVTFDTLKVGDTIIVETRTIRFK